MFKQLKANVRVMEEGIGNIEFKTLYGWKSSRKYIVPVLAEYPAADDCFLLSLKPRNGPNYDNRKVIQEYDSCITSADVSELQIILRDLQMKGIMVGEADEETKKLAGKYGIEIKEVNPRARLRVRKL